MRDFRDEVLLKEYLKRFENYSNATKKIKNIFAYMHRYFIPSHSPNDNKKIRDVFDVRPVALPAVHSTNSTKSNQIKSNQILG